MGNNGMKAEEWLKKARHDLDALQDVLKGSAHPDVAGVLLQQGVEKYLKGYLIGKGWRLIKTHDLKQLLDEAIRYNEVFKSYYDLLDMITEYYFEERYPFGETGISIEEIKENFEKVKKLIAVIKRDMRER